MLRCRPKHRNGDWDRLRRSNKGLNDDQPVHIRRSWCTCRRSRPCWNAPRAHGRTCPDGIRVGSCRRHHAADGERPPGAYGYGRPSQRREAGPASLAPSRIIGCSADDRKHHAGGIRPGLTATAARCRFEGCGFADGADLLRPSCRPSRCSARRRACWGWSLGARKRWRIGNRGGRRVFWRDRYRPRCPDGSQR